MVRVKSRYKMSKKSELGKMCDCAVINKYS